MRAKSSMRVLLLVGFVTLVCASFVPCQVDIGSDQSTQCQRSQFCSPMINNGKDTFGDPILTYGCTACEVSLGGGIPADGVYDEVNFCNCAAGSHCRQTAPTAAETQDLVGRCEPSSLIGRNCSVDKDCQTDQEVALEGFSREERGFCVNGRCGQCDPVAFQAVHQSDSFACPGYVLLSNGARRYLSARPGIVIKCLADGTLSESGAVNMELLAWQETAQQPTASVAPIKKVDKKEESFVPALLSVLFVIGCVALFGVYGFGIADCVARRKSTTYQQSP